jgi:hypothetical protein
MLTKQCVQKHVGAVPEADDRVAGAHRVFLREAAGIGVYFRPVLVMPWIK